MIDWSDLGRKRSGLFAAVCYRKRGLALGRTHFQVVGKPNHLDGGSGVAR